MQQVPWVKVRSMRRLILNEDGAVTIDWVVITAAILGLALVVLGTISDQAKDNAENLGAYLSAQTVSTY